MGCKQRIAAHSKFSVSLVTIIWPSYYSNTIYSMQVLWKFRYSHLQHFACILEVRLLMTLRSKPYGYLNASIAQRSNKFGVHTSGKFSYFTLENILRKNYNEILISKNKPGEPNGRSSRTLQHPVQIHNEQWMVQQSESMEKREMRLNFQSQTS